MDEDGRVFPGRRLQAELRVRCLGVVGEGDGAGQLPVVQHLLVVLGQVDVALRLELERALRRRTDGGWREGERGEDVKRQTFNQRDKWLVRRRGETGGGVSVSLCSTHKMESA